MDLPVAAGPSERVQIAAVARDAALATPGVVDLDSGVGGRFATVGGATRVAGVTSAVAPEGGFDVALRLVCELVALPALADKVRRAIVAASRHEKLALATVTIDVVDVIDGDA